MENYSQNCYDLCFDSFAARIVGSVQTINASNYRQSSANCPLLPNLGCLRGHQSENDSTRCFWNQYIKVSKVSFTSLELRNDV